MSQHRLTQHKRFVPYGTHPNFTSQKLLLCWERWAKGGGYFLYRNKKFC